jgi:hypothetical protein
VKSGRGLYWSHRLARVRDERGSEILSPTSVCTSVGPFKIELNRSFKPQFEIIWNAFVSIHGLGKSVASVTTHPQEHSTAYCRWCHSTAWQGPATMCRTVPFADRQRWGLSKICGLLPRVAASQSLRQRVWADRGGHVHFGPLDLITLHENRHAHRIVAGQPEGKAALPRPKNRRRILINFILRKVKMVTAFNFYKQWLFQPYRREKCTLVAKRSRPQRWSYTVHIRLIWLSVQWRY